MDSKVSDATKIAFLDHRLGIDTALEWAESRFHQTSSPAALQYLLDKLPDVGKAPFVAEAKKKGGALLSVLDDFGFKTKSDNPQVIAVYLNTLKQTATLRGFTLETEKGNIHCRFFPREAPLTCLSFAKLAKKGYFDHSRFHRVVPAFVAQDGDPTGTGSGGPGYSIRCEYNELNYDRAGRVGMALSGKDTGGSQFFLTHLATPHLNQEYTIFGQLIDGMDVLDKLEQLDEIKKVTVDETSETH
ncbi:MAG: peptidylprolyl isomerase [Acidobacteria bacterium]|nr:peptidylprolyl isomerase [Acidobacteriota bacterium]